MTTYVFGAGASAHAGYPLCAELWPRLLIWIIESEGSDSEFRQAVELITALTGPVTDIEALFTDLDLNRGVFSVWEVIDKNGGSGTHCVYNSFDITMPADGEPVRRSTLPGALSLLSLAAIGIGVWFWRA